MKRWAREHDECVECGTTDRPHRALGLCGRCYSALPERRAADKKTRARFLERDPDYARKRRARQLELYPDYDKKTRARQLELHPDFYAEQYARKLELHPSLGKEQYARMLELHPDSAREACLAYLAKGRAAQTFFALNELQQPTDDEEAV